MENFHRIVNIFIEEFKDDLKKSSRAQCLVRQDLSIDFCSACRFAPSSPLFEVVFSFNTLDKTEDSSVIVEKEVTESVSGLPKDVQTNKGRENIVRAEPSRKIDMAGEISIETSISADDVLRAGGFGARDDIGSFLPVASDSTDFEATILNARDYEGPQGEISRPGLGWKEATKAE